ncbi:hypothetical protein CRUP_033019 [Coryphaenoides rupestris]|nr:hypothetical protein CRUP_033019 [Coryphaenoides rupestris]
MLGKLLAARCERRQCERFAGDKDGGGGGGPLSRRYDPMWIQYHNVMGGGATPVTHSDAEKSWLLLVAMPLMGQSCPRSSPRGARVSACQRRSRPPRQPPTTTGDPGNRLRALAQSPGLLTHCWGGMVCGCGLWAWSHLRRSHMRTALPAAAYRKVPAGLRATWLIWLSPGGMPTDRRDTQPLRKLTGGGILNPTGANYRLGVLVVSVDGEAAAPLSRSIMCTAAAAAAAACTSAGSAAVTGRVDSQV